MLKLEKRNKVDSEIPSSSMADIAFLLIIFFMVTTVFSATRGLEFQLPKEEDAAVLDEVEAVIITIRQDTKILVFDEPKELDQLVDYLVEKWLNNNPEKPVILITDPKAPYYAMVNVLDALQRAKEEKNLVKDINVGIPTQREIEEMWGGIV